MHGHFGKNRIEALSDGVFAIAMTLLVLDIKVPVDVPRGQLAAVLAKDFHSWISYAVTFMITSVFWVLQHRLLDLLEHITIRILIPSFIFLGFVSILPFSTSLWGHHSSESIAFAVYYANQMALAFTLVLQLEVARMQGHLHAGVRAQSMRFRLWGIAVVMLTAFAAAALLPVEWIWPVPLAMAVIAKLTRRRRERRLLGSAGEPVAEEADVRIQQERQLRG